MKTTCPILSNIRVALAVGPWSFKGFLPQLFPMSKTMKLWFDL